MQDGCHDKAPLSPNLQMLLLEELERTSHSEPSHEEGDVWGAVSHGADRSPHSPSREASARHDPLLAIVLSKRREVDFIGMDGFLRPSYTVAGDESSAQ